MNQQIHKDTGSPKKMPSPFDRKLRSAAEDAVDWHWDEWPEYKRDRDGLIDNAVRGYLRSYFPKEFNMMVRMFEPMESVVIKGGKRISESDNGDTLGELNNMTLGQLERIEDYAEMISDRMEGGQQLDSWMFSQITVALDNLNAVHDAMDGVDGVEESQVNEKIKLIMRNILTKMIPAAFGPSTNPKMREEIKDAVKTAIEPILMKYDYIVESKESDALAKEIDKAMIKIDDSMSYEDFADAVATILRDEYGSHNYTKFLKSLKDKL